MKKRLFNFIIDACYRIDEKRGNLDHYEYETAPYCGHHYSGANGVLYRADYHEGDGGECGRLFGFSFHRTTDNEYFCNFNYALGVKIYVKWDGSQICDYRIHFNFSKRNLKVLRKLIKDIKSPHFTYKLKLEKL